MPTNGPEVLEQTPTWRLRGPRVAAEAAISGGFATWFGVLALTEPSFTPRLRILGVFGAVMMVGVLLSLFSRPRLLPGRLSVGVGPLRRSFTIDRYVKVATGGPRIVMVRPDGTIQAALTTVRFAEPERLRAEIAAWAREQGLDVVD